MDSLENTDSRAQECSQAVTDCMMNSSAAIMDSNPPFLSTYMNLLNSEISSTCSDDGSEGAAALEKCCELPLLDLSRLDDELHAERCKQEMVAAACEWGFFQIVNHGIPATLLARLREEQIKMFRQPFEKKTTDEVLSGFPGDSYRWGTPTATSLKQLSWLEAYHVPLSVTNESSWTTSTSRLVIEEISSAMSRLAEQLIDTLAHGLGFDGEYIKENCKRHRCYLRLNRYPPCPIPAQVFGLVPHTDSAFLTILCQDQLVMGLQLNKGGTWFTVKPNPNALIINIGDLFQAWSNGLYKSVEHRVMSNRETERFSMAYFVCPSMETMIQSSAQPAMYRRFSFGEYRQQVQQDVRLTGYKIGLTRFLA